jgi:hypothetical protein
METFNKKRFMQVARYDLTIHRRFYRNMVITFIAILVGIALLGFTIRYGIKINMDEVGVPASMYDGIGGTASFMLWFMYIIQIGCAGCIFHSLRNKQSRIAALTLPATNLEKFLWHSLVAIAGGWLIGVVGLLLSDALNALLSLIAGFPLRNIHSLTLAVANLQLFNFGEVFDFKIGNIHDFDVWESVSGYVYGLYIVGSVWTISAFVLGNAVKYKYNILLTLLGLWIMQMVLSLIMVMIGSSVVHTMVVQQAAPTEEQAVFWLKTLYYVAIAFLIATSILAWWGSWRLYKRAQVTTQTNRS